MAVDAQWDNVAAMLPLSADFSDARGNASFFGTNSPASLIPLERLSVREMPPISTEQQRASIFRRLCLVRIRRPHKRFFNPVRRLP
jgi:hypothetical protein